MKFTPMITFLFAFFLEQYFQPTHATEIRPTQRFDALSKPNDGKRKLTVSDLSPYDTEGLPKYNKKELSSNLDKTEVNRARRSPDMTEVMNVPVEVSSAMERTIPMPGGNPNFRLRSRRSPQMPEMPKVPAEVPPIPESMPSQREGSTMVPEGTTPNLKEVPVMPYRSRRSPQMPEMPKVPAEAPTLPEGLPTATEGVSSIAEGSLPKPETVPSTLSRPRRSPQLPEIPQVPSGIPSVPPLPEGVPPIPQGVPTLG